MCACTVGAEQTNLRPVTGQDAVEMNEVGEPNLNFRNRDIAKFSPDGKRFVIQTRRAHIENNTNIYSLLLFNANDALSAPSPDVLVSFSSSSNRPAIEDVEWSDNRTIVF